MRNITNKFRFLCVLLAMSMAAALLPTAVFAAGDYPELVSASVTETGGVELEFDMPMADPAGNVGAFVLRRSHDYLAVPLSSVGLKSGDDTTIELIPVNALKGGYAFDISYNALGASGGTVESADEKILQPFSIQPVANPLPHPTVTSGDPPAGTVGTAYEHTFIAEGGAAPYTFFPLTLPENLPEGLALGVASGVLSGTPAESGEFSLQLIVTDWNGAVDIRDYVIVVNPAASIYLLDSNDTLYDTLQEAVGAAAATDTVTLQEAFADTAPVAVNGKAITLDLDGNALTLNTTATV